FEARTIERLSEHFRVLVEGIVESPSEPVRSLALVSEAEGEELLGVGRGAVLSELGGSVTELFEEQARESCGLVAVKDVEGEWSYEELNAESNRLAHYLLERGVCRGSLVGLCVERSRLTLLSMLGVLKTGGAYVPLDARLPSARVEELLRESGCEWVLTEREVQQLQSFGGCRVLPLDEEIRGRLLGGCSETNPEVERGLEDLAYVIYTSGSTGRPKGVMVDHGALASYCRGALESYYEEGLTGAVVGTSCSFDLTVPSLYLPLLSGGRVQLLGEVEELEGMARSLLGTGERILYRLTPSHVQGLLPLLGEGE